MSRHWRGKQQKYGGSGKERRHERIGIERAGTGKKDKIRGSNGFGGSGGMSGAD